MIKMMSEDLRTFSTIENFILRTSLFRPFSTHAHTLPRADRSEGYMLIGVRGIC